MAEAERNRRPSTDCRPTQIDICKMQMKESWIQRRLRNRRCCPPSIVSAGTNPMCRPPNPAGAPQVLEQFANGHTRRGIQIVGGVVDDLRHIAFPVGDSSSDGCFSREIGDGVANTNAEAAEVVNRVCSPAKSRRIASEHSLRTVFFSIMLQMSSPFSMKTSSSNTG